MGVEMTSITIKDQDGSVKVETDKVHMTIFDFVRILVIPALLAQGYTMETIEEVIKEEWED